MKKLLMMTALLGLLSSSAVAGTFGDDKGKKAKKECCKSSDKACAGEKKEGCAKGEKSCCKAKTETATTTKAAEKK
jgi:hypothetical protein